MIDMVEKARLFATAAHGAIGQKRKYVDEPYIHHPERVVKILKAAATKGTPELGYMDARPITDEMLAAAWLHDVVEDTKIELKVIHTEFGCKVTTLVNWLTCQTTIEDGNREARNKMNIDFITNANPEAKAIKVADIIDNLVSIWEYDPKFAEIYAKEKQDMLVVLASAPRFLFQKACDLAFGNNVEEITEWYLEVTKAE
jgi:(p)ppGpp synthase/HD superfamily hydrolase